MIPKTEVEFRTNLGSAVSKSIELKNPSTKPLTYDVTIEGSPDFRASTTEVFPICSTHKDACRFVPSTIHRSASSI